MKNKIAQAFLMEVLQFNEAEEFNDVRKYFQNMARYKYDEYQHFGPGMRFIERFALWLKQFHQADRRLAMEFIRDKLVFVSADEMNLLVSSCFHDLIKPILIRKVADIIKEPEYRIAKITASTEYKTLLKQSLFCGLSDGAKTDIFRRANSGAISHEQIYQTYELSDARAKKMQEDLQTQLKKVHENQYTDSMAKFKTLFLMDDFSASGSTYLTEKKGELRGKIFQLYQNLKSNKNFQEIFDVKHLDVHVILYMCTAQAYDQITGLFDRLEKEFKSRPKLHTMHVIPDTFKISHANDKAVVDLCMNPKYYDITIEDEHTGSNVQLGYKGCALPLVLSHNCPNNSLSILWSYESKTFKGLFPRIPRHGSL
jgi:hypothetical protein